MPCRYFLAFLPFRYTASRIPAPQHMTDYSKITALYSRLSVGDEDRDGGESNSIQNQKIFLENYAKGL